MDQFECANDTFTIKYEDEYKVWNNFSIMHLDQVYHYYEYRVTDDGLQLCDSVEHVIQQRWRKLRKKEKKELAFKQCNVSVDGFFRNNYTLFKNLTVFFKPTQQSFTSQDYGVSFGYFWICSAKLNLSCNDHLVRVKYSEEYKVFKNFSLSYQMKHHEYREYRLDDDAFELCASNDSGVQAIWKTRNSWDKGYKDYLCSDTWLYTLETFVYVVGKQFNIFFAGSAQSFGKYEYMVHHGELQICSERLKPDTTDLTKGDMLLCSDSLIKIKFYDEYKVWNNFSVLYKNQMYDFTEYRVVNDSIHICNSADNFVQDSWRVRNKIVKLNLGSKHCNVWVDGFFRNNYTLFKNFTVFFRPTQQIFTSQDYGVIFKHFAICSAKLSLSCNHHLVKVKYSEKYKVFKNFALSYRKKRYNYREYRLGHDGIELCASKDPRVQAIWKTRNTWEKSRSILYCLEKRYTIKEFYIVGKQFNVFFPGSAQSFDKHEYQLYNGRLSICAEKLKPETMDLTKEDLLLCNDSLIKIKFDDQYKVRKNFSILFKKKVYRYMEYRVLDLDDSIDICNSTNHYVRYVWRQRNLWVKERLPFKHCSWVEGFFRNSYTLFKNFTVFFKPTQQSFTWQNYGVYLGYFRICSAKLTLSCNEHLVKVKYSEKYNVFKNFSVSYQMKHYNYREYRLDDDAFELCSSNDSRVQAIWKTRNSWVKGYKYYSCSDRWYTLKNFAYVVGKQFNIFYAGSAQSFGKYEYMVHRGELRICGERLKPDTTDLTKRDMLLCSDSLIKIKFEGEYRVWNNFSVLYKNQMYDYTEYRVVNDSINICNSTDNFVQDSWRVRSKIVKRDLGFKHCNVWVDGFFRNNYTLFKNFTVFFRPTRQSFSSQDYGVYWGYFWICSAKLSVSCNDYLVRVKYSKEYKVFKNFSVSYQMKHYDYREYRLDDDAFELCASNDSRVQAIWKTRNSWVKGYTDYSCSANWRYTLKTFDYIVGKHFNIFLAGSAQSFGKYKYMVDHGELQICGERLKPDTTHLTKEDMLLCYDSLIKIKFEDEYKVWNNFSILYKNKVYDYTEYRVVNDSINVCNSSDKYVQDSWKLRNQWVKETTQHNLSCKRIQVTTKKYTRNTVLQNFYLSTELIIKKQYQYTLLKNNTIPHSLEMQALTFFERKYRRHLRESLGVSPTMSQDIQYGVHEGKYVRCDERITKNLYVARIDLIMIAPLCALGLSIICLLLLLIVYGMLPELRTLPGLNLMSLSLAFLMWLIYLAFLYFLYVRVGDVFTIPCARLEIEARFTMNCIFTNAAVNIYHLRKTFYRNTLVKSDVNKWKTFLKYSFFSWGFPTILAMIHIVLLSKGVLRFEQSIAEGHCVDGYDIPGWITLMEKFGLPCCLLLYSIIMLTFTARRIRNKLKANRSIVQRSNTVRKRHSFVVLLKLSTTTAISWMPFFIDNIALNFSSKLKITIWTVMYLSGVYVGFAFVFTRKNYQLLKKKYFSAKVNPGNENMPG